MSHHPYKARVAELESLVDYCIDALKLVPTAAIRSGATWMPSPEALTLIELAKDRLGHYEAKRLLS